MVKLIKSRYKYYAETNQLYDNEKGKLYAYNLNKNKIISILNQQYKQIKELKEQLSTATMLMCSKENVLLKQQLKQAQNKKAIEELEGLQVQCQFDITFADYEQEQRLYDYINDRIKELKGVDVNA